MSACNFGLRTWSVYNNMDNVDTKENFDAICSMLQHA